MITATSRVAPTTAGGQQLLLRIRHVGNTVKLTSVRQRNPRISHACIMFALLWVVCFLCKPRALGGRFPCGLAFGSHLVLPRVGPPPSGRQCYIMAWKPRLTFCCWNLVRPDGGTREVSLQLPDNWEFIAASYEFFIGIQRRSKPYSRLVQTTDLLSLNLA